MKIDLTKTNGSSPPRTFHTDVKPELIPPLQPISSPPAADEILTIPELATWLKMKPAQVYELTRCRGQMRREHPLPVLRFHRKALRFRKSDVQEWLDILAQKARVQ